MYCFGQWMHWFRQLYFRTKICHKKIYGLYSTFILLSHCYVEHNKNLLYAVKWSNLPDRDHRQKFHSTQFSHFQCDNQTKVLIQSQICYWLDEWLHPPNHYCRFGLNCHEPTKTFFFSVSFIISETFVWHFYADCLYFHVVEISFVLISCITVPCFKSFAQENSNATAQYKGLSVNNARQNVFNSNETAAGEAHTAPSIARKLANQRNCVWINLRIFFSTDLCSVSINLKSSCKARRINTGHNKNNVRIAEIQAHFILVWISVSLSEALLLCVVCLFAYCFGP